MPDEKPPFMGSWKNVYILIMGMLAFLIVLFWLFTQYYK